MSIYDFENLAPMGVDLTFRPRTDYFTPLVTVCLSDTELVAMSEKLDELRQQMLEMQDRLAALEAKRSPPPLPRPNGALTSRLDASYYNRKSRLQAMLRGALQDKYVTLARGDNVASNSHIDIEAWPRIIAAALTRETAVSEDLASAKRGAQLSLNDPRVDNSAKIIRLQVELAALKAHTEDLLASTTLPAVPPDLLAKLGQPAPSRAPKSVPLALPPDLTVSPEAAPERIAAAMRNYPPRT
jgi:hypothetical protein